MTVPPPPGLAAARIGSTESRRSRSLRTRERAQFQPDGEKDIGNKQVPPSRRALTPCTQLEEQDGTPQGATHPDVPRARDQGDLGQGDVAGGGVPPQGGQVGHLHQPEHGDKRGR